MRGRNQKTDGERIGDPEGGVNAGSDVRSCSGILKKYNSAIIIKEFKLAI
jgi:hypothetical protein